jgi:hypothetical protein
MAGRPSKYETHVQPKLLLIEAWARNGLTEEDICKNLDVSIAAFSNYKLEYMELKESLKRNKEEADVIVENSLYKRALGYAYEEVTREQKLDPVTGENILVVTKVVTKEVVPDTTAQIFWLKNRKPKEWRDRQEHEHSGNVGVNIVNNIPRNKGS